MNFSPTILPSVPPAAWLKELSDFLRIPSVSAAPEHRDDVLRAGRWVRDFVRGSGGSAELVERDGGSLVLGTVSASHGRAGAPRVTLYGHYDVQPSAPLDGWDTDPFEPTIRDGWIHARGATDNKGNLFCLLKAVELLRAEGRLGVDVDVLCEGEEEIGGQAIVEHLRADGRSTDVFLSFDSSRMKADRPMLYIGMRGLVYLRVRVRSGSRELHSGEYGGAAANALNALVDAVARLIPLPAELREGAIELTPAEREAVAALDPDRTMLADAGAGAVAEDSARRFWEATLAEPALDVHGIAGGSPRQQKAIVAPSAEAMLSIRTAPGQDAHAVAATAERLLRERLPAGAHLDVELVEATSGYVQDPDQHVLRLAGEAIERGTGRAPLALRAGSTIPILELVAARGTPIVLTGFGLPDSHIHAANERFRLDMLPAGVGTAMELLSAFATLPGEA